LLKVLENETQESLRLFHERALPDLGNNIKCGNSLIGPDFYQKQQLTLFGDEQQRKINAFDWQAGFPEIFKLGGFDAVIGNPPWISLTGKFRNDCATVEEIEYLTQKFKGNTYMPNIYEYFVSQGLYLAKIGGYFSFIVPDRLGFNSQFVDLRKNMLDQTNIIFLLYKIPFPGITADTLIFVVQKANKSDGKNIINIGEYGCKLLNIPQTKFLQSEPYSFQYFNNISTMNCVEKIEGSSNVINLNELFETTSGFGGKSSLISEKKCCSSQIEVIKGDSIERYGFRNSYWFEFKKENITGRTTDRDKLGSKPKLLLRKTGINIIATFDNSGIFPEQSLYFLFNNKSSLDYKYVLGILNSKLMTFYYQNRLITNKQSIAQLKKVHLDIFPIRNINVNSVDDKIRHDKMVLLVEQMLELYKKVSGIKNPDEKTRIQRQIDSTDGQIDKLVYDLYGLTADEIAIVEGRNKTN
jgi:hypothetical protein